MSSVYEWPTDIDALKTKKLAGLNWTDDMAPSDLNNNFRQMMASIRQFADCKLREVLLRLKKGTQNVYELPYEIEKRAMGMAFYVRFSKTNEVEKAFIDIKGIQYSILKLVSADGGMPIGKGYLKSDRIYKLVAYGDKFCLSNDLESLERTGAWGDPSYAKITSSTASFSVGNYIKVSIKQSSRGFNAGDDKLRIGRFELTGRIVGRAERVYSGFGYYKAYADTLDWCDKFDYIETPWLLDNARGSRVNTYIKYYAHYILDLYDTRAPEYKIPDLNYTYEGRVGELFRWKATTVSGDSPFTFKTNRISYINSVSFWGGLRA